jgi:hypothetical protein
VNLSGAFFLSQAALAHMMQRGTGRIVNVSSLAAETGNIGQANYTASKSGRNRRISAQSSTSNTRFLLGSVSQGSLGLVKIQLPRTGQYSVAVQATGGETGSKGSIWTC